MENDRILGDKKEQYIMTETVKCPACKKETTVHETIGTVFVRICCRNPLCATRGLVKLIKDKRI